jgi:hypothetical protein
VKAILRIYKTGIQLTEKDGLLVKSCSYSLFTLFLKVFPFAFNEFCAEGPDEIFTEMRNL